MTEMFKQRGVEYFVTEDRQKSSLNFLPSISSSFSNLQCFSCSIPDSKPLFDKMQQGDLSKRINFENSIKDTVSLCSQCQPSDVGIVKQFL